MSAAAAGVRALAILASSCAAFRTGGSSVGVGHHHHHHAIARPSGSLHDRVVALRYRNGDEELPTLDMFMSSNADGVAARHHDVVAASAGEARDCARTRGWAVSMRMFSSTSPTTSSPSSAVVVDEKQAAINEYLDYVEKRNRRLHHQSQSASTVVSGPQRVVLDFLAIQSHTTASPSSSVAAPSSRSVLEPASALSSTITRRGASSLMSRSTINSLKHVKVMLNNLRRVTSVVGSSSRIMTNFLSLHLLNSGGVSVASLALLLVLQPILKVALRQG